MEKLTFKVNEYEGPLDLILALLSKHQIEICDINISDLLEQYMACIRTLQEHQMEVASEFLEMASRLVYIKTASLLPREEKEEDPRAELVGQLLEYQSCKQAAALLRLLDDHKAGRAKNMTKIWSFYSFILWYELYFVNSAAPAGGYDT